MGKLKQVEIALDSDCFQRFNTPFKVVRSLLALANVDALLWGPSHGKYARRRPKRIHIDQLIDRWSRSEEILNILNDRLQLKKRVMESRASSSWWIWWPNACAITTNNGRKSSEVLTNVGFFCMWIKHFLLILTGNFQFLIPIVGKKLFKKHMKIIWAYPVYFVHDQWNDLGNQYVWIRFYSEIINHQTVTILTLTW